MCVCQKAFFVCFFYDGMHLCDPSTCGRVINSTACTVDPSVNFVFPSVKGLFHKLMSMALQLWDIRASLWCNTFSELLKVYVLLVVILE